MAKFNKDTFLNEITGKVQSAIDKNLITKEDIQNKDIDRLHGFIQYELLEYIEDRKFAIDVLKDFNYDEKAPWEDIQEHFGTFKSLMDIALVNLWKFLDSEGATQYEYYNNTAYDPDSPMLDLAHDLEDKAPYEDEDGDGYSYERPKLNRKIRLANQEDEPGEQDESYESQYESAKDNINFSHLNEGMLDTEPNYAVIGQKFGEYICNKLGKDDKINEYIDPIIKAYFKNDSNALAEINKNISLGICSWCKQYAPNYLKKMKSEIQ